MKALITDFGTVGDGQRVNTKEIQAAVDDCFDEGGGTVVVPAGVFVTGTIELKSHITLHLEQGAVLKGSSDMSDYAPRSFGSYKETPSLLVAVGQSDIRITGEGEIDQNDAPFMDWDTVKVAPQKETGVEF